MKICDGFKMEEVLSSLGSFYFEGSEAYGIKSV
jgi:hypothetical protein